MHLLLLSNSTNARAGYLAHAWDLIGEFFGTRRDVTFIPFADPNPGRYFHDVSSAFQAQGYRMRSLHESEAPTDLLQASEAVFVGGGNTFLLLSELRRRGLLAPLRQFAMRGGRHLSASAGSNIAAPTISTTNDMPIIHPGGFDALDLIPFQLNCHYLDPTPGSMHNGETRVERLTEYHQLNTLPVLGIREGVGLSVSDDRYSLVGAAVASDRGPALWFQPGSDPREVAGEITDLVRTLVNERACTREVVTRDGTGIEIS